MTGLNFLKRFTGDNESLCDERYVSDSVCIAKTEENSLYGRICMIPICDISPNPNQPRISFDKESIIQLADSIRRNGILQPLTVREAPEAKTDFELIAGERRLRAAKYLGMFDVPCLVTAADGKKSAEMAIIENLQREDLNIFEIASAIASLIDIYELTQEQAARQLSTSQSFVANKLRLLKFSQKEREYILENRLTERHARALLRISDTKERFAAAIHMVSAGMNVAKAEEYVEKLIAGKSQRSSEEKKPKTRVILKDIRLFYNTIDKAVDIVRQAGVGIVSRRREVAEGTEIVIVIPKKSA